MWNPAVPDMATGALMPIRPEMRELYPPEWPLISSYIRFDRALGRCECDGRCGAPMHRAWISLSLLHSNQWPDRCPNYHGDSSQFTGNRVVLTTMHLDHDPTNCDPENLMAGCQACHLAYDADHHAATKTANREKREIQMSLFPLPSIQVPTFENDGQAMAWLGVDAARWTAMFLQKVDLANAGPDFVHTVHGWFCNAIGAGQSNAESGHRSSFTTDDDPQVFVTTSEEIPGSLLITATADVETAVGQFDRKFGNAFHRALGAWLHPDETADCEADR